MAITSNKNLKPSDIEYINKAQAYQSGTAYKPSDTVSTDYWKTDGGGGGKNTLYGNAGQKSYAATGWTDYDLQKVRDYVQQYEADQATKAKQAVDKAKEDGKNEVLNNVGVYIDQALAPYMSQLSGLQQQQQMQYQQANALSKDQINSAYDTTARDYYRLYKTQQKELPQNLSKAGVTGGASESSQLKLMNAYSDNLYKNETARNSQLAGVDADYNNKVAQNSVAYANQLSNAYLQMAQQAYNYQQQEAIRQREAQEAKQLEVEKAQAAAAITSWNNQQQSDMEKALASGKTIWTWTDADGKIQWTTSESKGLAMGGKKRAPSSASTKKKVTDNNGAPSEAYEAAKRTALAHLNGRDPDKRIVGQDAVLNYIDGLTTLTETEKMQLIKELGI